MLEVGLVLEDATSGFCGAVLRWQRGLVVLEDRRGKQRSFPLGAGYWYEGSPVVLKAPPPSGAAHSSLTRRSASSRPTSWSSVSIPLARRSRGGGPRRVGQSGLPRDPNGPYQPKWAVGE